MQIEKWDNKYGELNQSNASKLLKAEGYNVNVYEYSPGTIFSDHTHNHDKKDMVLSGTFLIRVNKQDYILKAGDMLEIPAGTVHYAEVIGNETVLSIDATRS